MKPVKELPEGLRKRLGGTDWLLCRSCRRAFLRDDVAVDDDTFDKAVRFAPGSPDLGRLADAVMLRARCAYDSCRVPLDAEEWTFACSRHPEYPETPVEGQVYDEDAGEEECVAQREPGA